MLSAVKQLVAAAAAVLTFVACGDTAPKGEEAERLATVLEVRLERIIDDDDYPYRLTQVEFQGDVFVVQIADPLPAALRSDKSASELFMFGPLRMYRDAVAPYIDQFAGVARFILSIRDPDQTVYDIPFGTMRAFVAEDISEEEFVTEITISALTR